MGFHHSWYQGKGVLTQQEVVQGWPFLSSSGAGSPKVPSSIFSLKLLLLKIYASEQEPLDPQSIHRNLYSASTRPRRTREKTIASPLLPLQRGGHSIWFRTSPLFSTHQGYQGSANICPGIQQGWLGRSVGQMCRWWFSHLVVKKIILTPSQVGILIQTSGYVLCPVGEM